MRAPGKLKTKSKAKPKSKRPPARSRKRRAPAKLRTVAAFGPSAPLPDDLAHRTAEYERARLAAARGELDGARLIELVHLAERLRDSVDSMRALGVDPDAVAAVERGLRGIGHTATALHHTIGHRVRALTDPDKAASKARDGAFLRSLAVDGVDQGDQQRLYRHFLADDRPALSDRTAAEFVRRQAKDREAAETEKRAWIDEHMAAWRRGQSAWRRAMLERGRELYELELIEHELEAAFRASLENMLDPEPLPQSDAPASQATN